jgi:hypothetical protein
VLLGMQVQYSTAEPSTIADGTVIPFNSVINNQSPDLTLNAANGEITIAVPGNYYVNWWIAVDGSTVAPTITFSLALDGTPVSSAATPILSTQLTGADFITVAAAPSVLTLANATGNDIFLSSTTVQANLVIIQLST